MDNIPFLTHFLHDIAHIMWHCSFSMVNGIWCVGSCPALAGKFSSEQRKDLSEGLNVSHLLSLYMGLPLYVCMYMYVYEMLPYSVW